MKKYSIVLFFAFFVAGLWAQEGAPDAVTDANADAPAPAAAPENDIGPKVSYAVIHNEFYEASIKERNLARLTLESGNYDDSIVHSEEAERLARLSVEYIEKAMLRARALLELTKAKDHIAWAQANEAEQYYPKELSSAKGHYAEASAAKDVEDWQTTLDAALLASADLAGVAAPPPKNAPPPNMPPNPNEYTVRPWDVFGDCFWNISQWFYDTPWKWTVIYEANKDKLPDPNNPNLIEVGTVIIIPSINGEERTGRYDTGAPYNGSY
jgi:nucleoid-associated protein YgaU